MSGFVGWDTIPEYPDAQEFFDLADGGYMMYAPAVSDMSYGNIKTGVLLPWKASNGGRVCKLAKLFGHGEVYMKVIYHLEPHKSYLVNTIDDEIAKLRKLPLHRNVAPVYQKFSSTKNRCTYVIQENPVGKDLMEYMTENKHSEEKALNIIKQMALALHHCHKHDILHGDLRSSAVRVDKSGKVKILDFGLSPKLSGMDSKYLHTDTINAFKAPESLFTPGNQTFAGDMYSLGVIMYEMLHGTLPFTGMSEEMAGKMRLQDIHYAHTISKEAILLMHQLLAFKPWKRPRPKDVLEHPWMFGFCIEEVNYNLYLMLLKTGSLITHYKRGKEIVLLKCRFPDKNGAYSKGVNYNEILTFKPALSKTGRAEPLIVGFMTCDEEGQPTRKMRLEIRKWQRKLKKTPVFPIRDNLPCKSAPKTPLNNNDAKDTRKEMLGTETFSNKPASSESKVSIVGFNNVTSPPLETIKPPMTQPPKAHEPAPPPAGAKQTPLIPHPPGKPCPVIRGRSRIPRRMTLVPPPKMDTAPIGGLNFSSSAPKITSSPNKPCKPQRVNLRKSHPALKVLPPEPPAVLLNINHILPNKPPTLRRRPSGSITPIKAFHGMQDRKEMKSHCLNHPIKQQCQAGSSTASPKVTSQIHFMDVQKPTDSPSDYMPKSPPCNSWMKVQSKVASQSEFHAEQASSRKNLHHVPKPPSPGKSSPGKHKSVSQRNLSDPEDFCESPPYVPQQPSQGKKLATKGHVVTKSLLTSGSHIKPDQGSRTPHLMRKL